MDKKPLEEVIQLLKSPILITRVGLWLLPLHKVGQERDIAAQLGLDAIDMQSYLIESLPQGTVYSGLSQDKIIGLLKKVANRPDLSGCVLIYNFDLLLSYLSFSERQSLWDVLYNGFPHPHRAILILLPETTKQLLPVEIKLHSWSDSGRLA